MAQMLLTSCGFPTAPRPASFSKMGNTGAQSGLCFYFHPMRTFTAFRYSAGVTPNRFLNMRWK